ncbi:MAG: HAD-IIIC family phosphatase [Chlorobium limicola]|uniref:HAD-IIIC family phosphatase n=1 Tax=Chlorobium limicola TaxID=1092 RepID=UPI0023F521A4|nr:HAD-IIIC family phosphatase [Chlorobium limicola]NTV20933.1 HAD-IIIC family phosphatase [Chlorobium limicola]
MTNYFTYPLNTTALLRKKRAIRRGLSNRKNLDDKRIAILGGSTTAEIKDMLELFLLHAGIRPVFYESEYNRYFEDVMFPESGLKDFRPEIIYIHTTNLNIRRFPALNESCEAIEELLAGEMNRFSGLWERIEQDYGCPVIQNNFELPHYRILGNLDAYDTHGRTAFIGMLNYRFAGEAEKRKNLHLNDINYLSAWFGLERWHDRLFWYSYKYAMNYEAIPLLADSVASIIRGICGKAKKCLVLDLDNTLWGGVIGDDGLQGIRIGKETPEAEAYTEFQRYVRELKERGVLLAVCSKNDETNAREGFAHPDSILSADDFAAFTANWNPKHENIRNIAYTLNIGIDSLVFADDNPVEREIVRAQLAEVTVPELGSDIVKYIDILDKTGLFETVSLSADDLQRNLFYAGNAEREKQKEQYASYDEFLRSLKMVAEIAPFSPIYLDRITQLANKTNQFNLTTRRYTLSEIQAMADDDSYITLYGKLRDKFGDNGLVSVIAGIKKENELHIDLWLMSCRVLKRGMETAMLDALAGRARECGLKAIVGYYFPTAKNGMVKNLFHEMGFRKLSENSWHLDISGNYTSKNPFIEINQ